jgi:hypothetical protein
MPTGFLACLIADDHHCGPIERASVRGDHSWIPVSLHCFLREFQRSSLISLLRDIGFRNFAFVVDSAPKIMALSSNLDEDLIRVPLPLRAAPHGFRTPFPDLMCEGSAEPIDPETDTFVADIDATFVEQVLCVAK